MTVQPPALEIPDFDLKNKDWRKYFQDHGVVRLRAVLTEDEVREGKTLMWDWLEDLGSGINRKDIQTWTDDRWPGVQSLGFLPTHGGGHSRAAWYLRTRPTVLEAFSQIWNVTPQELLVSFDTFIAWRPWWNSSLKTRQPRVENLHIDQNPVFKPSFACVQGMLPLVSVDPRVGGLQVVPNTNTDETQQLLIKRYPNLKFADDDWLELSTQDPFMGKGRLVHARAGDLILWDSRTIHAGFVGSGPFNEVDQDQKEITAIDGPQLARLALTVCMTPASRAKLGVCQQRVRAFNEGRCLTHWPHEYHPHTMRDSGGSKIPTRLFEPVVSLNDPLIASLVGASRVKSKSSRSKIVEEPQEM